MQFYAARRILSTYNLHSVNVRAWNWVHFPGSDQNILTYTQIWALKCVKNTNFIVHVKQGPLLHLYAFDLDRY